MNIINSYVNSVPVPCVSKTPRKDNSAVYNHNKLEDKKENTDSLIKIGVAATMLLPAFGLLFKPKKLSDIKFEDGIAKLTKTGQKYTGKIKDKLANGDKVIFKLKDGKIKTSSVRGKRTITKRYYYDPEDPVVGVMQERNLFEYVCLNRGKHKIFDYLQFKDYNISQFDSDKPLTATIKHKYKTIFGECRVDLTCENSVLTSSKKVNPNGEIEFLKRYYYEGKDKIVEVFKPDENSVLKKFKTLIIGEENVRVLDENGIEQLLNRK